jgi:hypothetical protein
MAYVQVPSVNGFGGFSWGKLTTWVGNTAAAVVSGDKTKITAQLTQAIPGATVSPAKPPAPPVQPGLMAPGGFVEKNQTMLIVAAAGLALFLVMGRKMGRR